MGIASLVLGIIAFIIAITFVFAPLGVILAVVGLILGIVDTVKKGKAGQKKVISIVGLIICAIIFVVLIVESFIIGIGFAAYDSLSDAANAASDAIEETEKNAFNSFFEYYEGTQSGLAVINLLDSIYTNNTNYTDHQITVYYNGTEKDLYSISSEINSSESYNISLSEDINGYIYRVYITPENTGIDNNINTNNDTYNNISTGNSSNTTSITGSSSSKTSPLSVGEWGIASKYYSGEYVDVPVRVTNITRGSAAAQEVEEYCNSGSSIYRYEDAEEDMEWAVIEYAVDLTSFDTNTSTSLERRITGTGDNTSVRHRGTTYIISTMNMSSDYASGEVATAKFATQLPIGCSDYLIVLGTSGDTQAFFQGE